VAGLGLMIGANIIQVYTTNVQRFRGGLVFKAHRLLYHSTLGLKVLKKRRRGEYGILGDPYADTLRIRNSLLLGPYSRAMPRAIWWS